MSPLCIYVWFQCFVGSPSYPGPKQIHVSLTRIQTFRQSILRTAAVLYSTRSCDIQTIQTINTVSLSPHCLYADLASQLFVAVKRNHKLWWRVRIVGIISTWLMKISKKIWQLFSSRKLLTEIWSSIHSWWNVLVSNGVRLSKMVISFQPHSAVL